MKTQREAISAELGWLDRAEGRRRAREGFDSLTHAAQTAAVCRLADEGYGEYTIAQATRWNVEQVRGVLSSRGETCA